MTPKRGERVAPPPGPDQYDVVFGTNEAAKVDVDRRKVFLMVAGTGHPKVTE